MGSNQSTWPLIAVVLMAAGCAATPRYEPNARVRWADEAGSVTVAHVASMRWEEAQPLLQPKFAMNSDIALTSAFPTTGTLDDRIADILAASLKVALPTASVTNATTETGTLGATETKVNNVRTVKEGDPSTASDPTLAAAAAAGLAGLTPGSAIGQDPMLRYIAAAAVFQEVNLLNRYVTDAVRYRGAQAFLVRLQVSVLPSRRAMPYDVTTDITIHPGDIESSAGLARTRFDVDQADVDAWSVAPAEAAASLTATASREATAEAVRLREIELQRRRQPAAGRPQLPDSAPPIAKCLAADAPEIACLTEAVTMGMRPSGAAVGSPALRRCLRGGDSLTLVPLVVTDNLEGLAASRTTDVTRQLALSLIASAANVGASGQFARTKEELRRQEGRDANSLLTVARLTDDTVRVRLGAAQSPRFGNVMVPRTHNISLLVIFKPCRPEMILPNGEQRILSVVTKAAYTDAQTGVTLPYRPVARRLLAMTNELNRIYNNTFNYLEYAGLYLKVSQQDRAGYDAFFDERIARYKLNAVPCGGLSPGSVLGGLVGGKGLSRSIKPDDLAAAKQLFGIQYADLPRECMSEQLAFQVARSGLWTDLQSRRPIAEFSYASVPLVLRRIAPTAPSAEQTVIVSASDSGVGATLYQGRDLSLVNDIRATLTLLAGKGLGAQMFSLPSTSVAVAPDGGTVSLRFPSYSSIQPPKGADGKPLTLQPCMISVSYASGGNAKVESRDQDPSGTFCAEAATDASAVQRDALDGTSVRYANLRTAAPKAAAVAMAYSLSAPAPAIVVGVDGRGRITLFAKAEKTEADPKAPVLNIEGAEVTSITKGGAALAQRGSGWALPGAGEYTLQLDNLVPGQIVQMTVVDTQDDGTEKQIATRLSRPIFGRLAPGKD